VRAAVITALTGPDGVVIREVPEPRPQPGQVLIDVEYAGVVFPDVLYTRGQYQSRPELPFVPGWELSGVVRADVGAFRAGDRVAALPAIGSFAETVAVDARMVFPLPAGVSFEKAAAIPLNYLTMQFAFTRRGQLKRAETVLVHGAAGGLGIAACQLARAAGARVIAVVSSANKALVAAAAGAHDTVRVDGFRAAVRALTLGRGVDLIVDPVGGDRITDSLRCLAAEGRLLVLGFTGREIPTVKVNRLLLGNTTVMGVGSREFWAREPDLPARHWRDLVPLIDSAAIDPPIGQTFTLDDVGSAIRALDLRQAAGRVLVRVA
jgi:NADPH2:quinone reductase